METVDPMRAPMTDPEEKKQAQIFVEKFVAKNPGLSDEAKAKITKLVLSVRGPWAIGNFAGSVTQNGDKISVESADGGASFYYLNDLN